MADNYYDCVSANASLKLFEALFTKITALENASNPEKNVMKDIYFNPYNGDIDLMDKSTMEGSDQCTSVNVSLKLFQALYTKITALENENATLKEQIEEINNKLSNT